MSVSHSSPRRITPAGYPGAMFGTLWDFLVGPGIDGFEQHLIDAIAVNTERCDYYGEHTDGDSDALFASLISSERLIRPMARFLDAWAVDFVADGVPVVVNDFVPMEDNLPVTTPIKSVEPMTQAHLDAADAIIETLLDDSSSLKSIDVVDASAEALHALEALEEDKGVYFAMSRHVIESLGFAALHGLYYNCETSGETADLVDALVRYQRLGLVVFDVTDYDRDANVFHLDGLGVLVNDLPAIPFLAEYEDFQDSDRDRLSACW